MMMNLIVILAFSVLIPSYILCGTIGITGTNPSKAMVLSPPPPLPTLRRPIQSPPPYSKTLNSSSQDDFRNKREIPIDSTDMFYPDYRITAEMMPKRTANGLNKFIYVLRNSFDKSAPPESEVVPNKQDTGTFTRDVTGAITRGSSINRFSAPAAAVERRGQTIPQSDRKIYLRCYFNAVSCFKKKK